jgi:hypothetical protein
VAGKVRPGTAGKDTAGQGYRMRERYLVTGGAGFVGSHLVAAAAA